jgi:hypothetical protein
MNFPGITGVDEMQLQQFEIYPNPVSDNRVNIRFAEKLKGSLLVTDLAGRVVLDEKLDVADGEILEIVLPQLNNGLYIFNVAGENGFHKSKMVSVVQRN